MSKNNRSFNFISASEFWLGLLYFLFQLLLLPLVLSLANAWLGYPLGAAWLNIVYFSVNFIAVLVIFRGFLGRSVTALGKNFLRVLRGAFLGFCVYYVSFNVLTNVLLTLFPEFSNINDSNITSMVQTARLPMVIGTVFLVPMVEEVLHRGLIFHSVYKKNRALGYIATCAVFGFVHICGYLGTAKPLTLVLCFLQYIPASLCLAWSYTEADNIFAPILIHMAINAMGVGAVR